MEIHKYKYKYKVVLDVTEEGTGNVPADYSNIWNKWIKTPKFEINASTQIQVHIQGGIGCNRGGNGATSQQITQKLETKNKDSKIWNKCKQDKVNTADSAFIFLIIQSQINGQVGQVGEDGLVWSGLC